MARDQQCADCGVGAPLHAHHIKPKSLYPELRFDLSNGMALCPTCHWKRHEQDRGRSGRGGGRPHRKSIERALERAHRDLAGMSHAKAELLARIKVLEHRNARLEEMVSELEEKLRRRAC